MEGRGLGASRLRGTEALGRPLAGPHGIIPQGSGLPELGVVPGPGFPEGVCVRPGGWLGSPTWWLPDRKSASLWAPIPPLRAPLSPQISCWAGPGKGGRKGEQELPLGLISLKLQALPCSGTFQGSPVLTRPKCLCRKVRSPNLAPSCSSL